VRGAAARPWDCRRCATRRAIAVGDWDGGMMDSTVDRPEPIITGGAARSQQAVGRAVMQMVAFARSPKRGFWSRALVPSPPRIRAVGFPSRVNSPRILGGEGQGEGEANSASAPSPQPRSGESR
jgi:hypothetical protein